MKVNTSAWHYYIMSYFKWCRKDSDDYTGWKYDKWFSDAGGSEVLGNYKGFKAFKRFMDDTGTFQPVDFCSYWRNVLVWPLVFLALWVPAVAILVLIATTIAPSSIGFAAAMFAGGGSAAMAIVVATVAGIDWIEKQSMKPKKEKKPGFFSKVGEALRNPELCSIMEYEKKDSE